MILMSKFLAPLLDGGWPLRGMGAMTQAALAVVPCAIWQLAGAYSDI